MNKFSRQPRRRTLALAALAACLPIAVVFTAQALAPAGDPAPPAPSSLPVNLEPAAAATPPAPPAQPQPWRTPLPEQAIRPLPATFDVAAIESLAEQLTWGTRVPGLSMSIVQGGQVLSARGYGVTDVSNPEPVDAHTVFRIASLSKAFAGTLAGVLVEDGLLRWDSRIIDHVPGFALRDPAATQSLTVAHVLSHQVGLTYNAFDRDVEANADYHTLTRKLSGAPLTCLPGQCYAYQNVAFSLIGDVVFAATGDFYEQSVEKRLLKPLGMHDASLGLHGIMGSNRWARPHVRSRNGWAALTPKPTYYRVAPAAGVNASAADMAQWLLAHTGHRTDVLSKPLLATLHAPLVSTPGELRSGWRRERLNAAGYGLGWRVFDYQGHTVVFHAGAVQGYRALLALLPERDMGVSILWNGESTLPSGLLPTIIDAALGQPLDSDWLDVSPLSPELLRAQRPADAPVPSGISSQRALTSPP